MNSLYLRFICDRKIVGIYVMPPSRWGAGALSTNGRCLSVCSSVCPVPDPNSRMKRLKK